MDYKHCCVIDADGVFREFVLVRAVQDCDGEIREEIEGYTLGAGERLVETVPPTIRPFTGAEGFVRPKWKDTALLWIEEATAEELATWEAEHPAPPPPNPDPVEELQLKNRILEAQLNAETDRQDFLEDCIAEMAVQIYSV